MKDSTSQISPAWPTRWPKDSFSPGWTFGFLLLLAGATLVAFVAAAIAAVAWLYIKHPQALAAFQRHPTEMNGTVFLAFAAAQVAGEAVTVIVILAALPSLTHFSLAQLGFRPIGLRAIWYGLLGAAGMVVVADVGGNLIESATHSTHQQLAIHIFENIRHDPRLVISFAVFAVILQPFVEEMGFRVFLFNLGLRYGGFWIGALISGVLFGLTHLVSGSADATSSALLAVGGIILAWVYYRSRNAYASMISHALFNGLSTAALYFAPKLAGS
ncbi:MAG TPA: type II CAAX endopeptidase family protein [Candidatus Tyrphobacter sp.]